VRQALQQPLAPHDQLVTGFDRSLLALQLLRPTVLTLQMTVEDVAHLPPMPVTAIYQLDAGPEQRVTLTPQAPTASRQFSIPAGAHAVRVWIAQPIANQALRVRFVEVRPDLSAAEKVGAVLGAVGSLPAGPRWLTLPLAAGPGPQDLRQDRFLVRTLPREYHVATPAQPVEISVEGPAWLRVDELRGDVTLTRSLLVEPGRRTVTLRPEAGQREALFRVFRRVLVPDQPIALPRYIPVPPCPVPWAVAPPPRGCAPAPGGARGPGTPGCAPKTALHPGLYSIGPAGLPNRFEPLAGDGIKPRVESSEPGVRGPQPVASLTTDNWQPTTILEDAYRLGSQEDGTWSLTAEYRRRRALDEEAPLRAMLGGVPLGGMPQEFAETVPDVFTEMRATHRYLDEWCRKYYQTDILGRIRDGSGPTLAVREHVRWDPACIPAVFHLEANGYMQHPSGAIIPGTGGLEATALVRGWVTQYRELTPELAHVPSALLFGRLMTLNEVEYLPGRVDQDIFTQYKAEHHAGLQLADTLIYRPTLDSWLWGRLGVMTNQEFITLDHLTVWAGWRQMAGDLRVNLAYQMIVFFEDQDRPQTVTRHLLDLQATSYLWPKHRNCVEVGVGWQHDLSRNKDSINVFLTWYFSNGRRFRDFRPDELEFPDLQHRLAVERLKNNHVWQVE
jgi:hypothetical protein